MLAGQRMDEWTAYIQALRQTLRHLKAGGSVDAYPAEPQKRAPAGKGGVARKLLAQVKDQSVKNAMGKNPNVGTAPAPTVTTAGGTGTMSNKQIQDLWKAYKRSLSYLVNNLKRGSVPSTSPLPSPPTSGQPGRALARDLQKLMERDYPNAVQVARNIEAKRAADATINAPPPDINQTDDPQGVDDPYRDAPMNTDFVMPGGEFQPPPGEFSVPQPGDTPLTTQEIVGVGPGGGGPMSTQTKVIVGLAVAGAVWYFWFRKKRR